MTGVPAQCYSANPNPRLLLTHQPTRLYHLSRPSWCLLCHFAHNLSPHYIVGMTTLFALFPPAPAASPSVAAGDASLSDHPTGVHQGQYVFEESNPLLM